MSHSLKEFAKSLLYPLSVTVFPACLTSFAHLKMLWSIVDKHKNDELSPNITEKTGIETFFSKKFLTITLQGIPTPSPIAIPPISPREGWSISLTGRGKVEVREGQCRTDPLPTWFNEGGCGGQGMGWIPYLHGRRSETGPRLSDWERGAHPLPHRLINACENRKM